MTPTADDRGGGFSGPLQGELYRWRSFATAPRLGGVIAIPSPAPSSKASAQIGPSGKSSHRDLRFTSLAAREGRSPARRRNTSRHEKERIEGPLPQVHSRR
jgi:hypothetical protein